MQYLLDTQVLVWLVDDSKKFGAKTKALFSSHYLDVTVSYQSFVEIAMKRAVGKMVFDTSVIRDLDGMGFDLLVGDEKTLSKYRIFNPTNKDPFDNFLIAAAIAHNLTLVTADKRILSTQAAGLQLLDATE